MSAELQMVRDLLAAAPLFGDPDQPLDVVALRGNLDALTASFPLPDGLDRTGAELAGVPTDFLTPDEARPGTLLYLHGGGYVIGSRSSHAGIGAALAVAIRRRVAMLDYRLGPESPFPAAVDDAVAAYRALLGTVPPGQLAIAGDSAGGGLTLATLVALRDQGMPLPAAAVCLSPWTDLRCISGSMEGRADVDPLCDQRRLLEMADAYLGGTDPSDPLASPLLADLSGLPPLLVQVGDAEILLDDAVELEARAGAAGVDVELEIWDDMIHVFQTFVGLLPEAEQALDRVAVFLEGHLT